MKMPEKLLSICLVLLVGLTPGTAARADDPQSPAFNIPRLENISIDGNAGDWTDNGFRVDCLADTSSEHPAGFESKFRLAWDDRGLLAIFTVADSTPFEGADDKLSSGDSVQLTLATRPKADDSIDVIVSPGHDKNHSKIRKLIIDNRKSSTALNHPLDVTVARSLVPGGYVIEMLIPWNDLGLQPKAGLTIAVQAIVTDGQSENARFQSVWFPDQGPKHTEHAFAVRLSDAPSAPQRVSVFGNYSHFRSSVLITSADEASRFIATWPNGDGIQGRLTHHGEHWVGMVSLPAPVDSDPDPPLNITVGNQGTPPLRFGNVALLRHKAFIEQPIQFESVVFGDEKFPARDLKNPNLAEDLIGPFTLSTTFYNAKFELVTSATMAGRYGAVTEIRNSTGVIARRFSTLYRTAKPVSFRHACGVNATTLPSETGIDPTISSRQISRLKDFADWQLNDGMKHDSDAAVWLSWLHECKGDEPANLGWGHAETADQKWWFDLKTKLGLPREYPFMVQKPTDYDSDPDKRWPTIIFLSGVGERGDNLNDLLVTGLPKYVKNQKNFPFLVISPQCPQLEYWNPWEVNAVIERVCREYHVDESRIYLTGLSMGGEGAWMTGALFPKRFAAVVPIAGGADPADVVTLKDVPVWSFHGGKDDGLDEDNRCIEALRAAGGQVKYTVYPEMHHDVWTKTYANPELYQWLLQHWLSHSRN